jgi:SRSO17 transposase
MESQRAEVRPVFVSDAVSAEDVRASLKMVRSYVKPYQEVMVRREQGEHLETMIAGMTSGLERKSVEPIAVMHGVPRQSLQRFVGETKWRHEPLVQTLRTEVAAEIGLPEGSVVVDGSATPKKGDTTVGVARQWCGRLGKVDNCVVGVYASYVGKNDLAALVGAELYLPSEWTEDEERRANAHVPKEVEYLSQQQIAGGLIHELAGELPFEWVLGDDEFGRARHFRDSVAELGKGYVLDVPENTVVHRINAHGNVTAKKWTVKELTRSRPVREWSYFKVREAKKGPIEVRSLRVKVATPRKPDQWVQEELVVVETLDGSQRWYCLARPVRDVELAELVRQAGLRHKIEEVFEETKGEVGLDHFEVRSWHGWYHHMTLAQLSHWFLVREKRRLGKKSTRHHRQPNPHGHRHTPRSATHAAAGREAHQLPPDAELPVALRAVSGPGLIAAAPFLTPRSDAGQ